MTTKNDDAIKIGLGVWVCFCALLAIYVFTRFLRGKQRVFNNLHVVEECLRRMQDSLELERRKKSIGFVETLEDIIGGMDEEEEEEKEEQEAAKEAKVDASTEEGAESESSLPQEEKEEEEEEDKKNV